MDFAILTPSSPRSPIGCAGGPRPLFLSFSFSEYLVSISFSEIFFCTYTGALPSGRWLSLFPHLVSETFLRPIHRLHASPSIGPWISYPLQAPDTTDISISSFILAAESESYGEGPIISHLPIIFSFPGHQVPLEDRRLTAMAEWTWLDHRLVEGAKMEGLKSAGVYILLYLGVSEMRLLEQCARADTICQTQLYTYVGKTETSFHKGKQGTGL
jgi:hypothetical protein